MISKDSKKAILATGITLGVCGILMTGVQYEEKLEDKNHTIYNLSNIHHVQTKDLNNDGIEDIIISNTHSNQDKIFLGTQDGNYISLDTYQSTQKSDIYKTLNMR